MSSTLPSNEETPRRRSRWTDVLLTICGVFVLTVLLMVASAFDRNAGVLSRLFDRHGLSMLAVEVGAILIVAIIVLTVERRESRRRIREREAALLQSERVDSEISRSGLTSDSSASSVEQP